MTLDSCTSSQRVSVLFIYGLQYAWFSDIIIPSLRCHLQNLNLKLYKSIHMLLLSSVMLSVKHPNVRLNVKPLTPPSGADEKRKIFTKVYFIMPTDSAFVTSDCVIDYLLF